MEITTTHSHKSTTGTEVTHAALYGVGEMEGQVCNAEY
jgi:hypothetical protein